MVPNLHIFTDSSMRAYGVCAYLLTENTPTRLWFKKKPSCTYQTYTITLSRIDRTSSWSQDGQEPEWHIEHEISNNYGVTVKMFFFASFKKVNESIHFQKKSSDRRINRRIYTEIHTTRLQSCRSSKKAIFQKTI